MSKKIIIITVAVVLVLISAVLVFHWQNDKKTASSSTPSSELAEIILFYGDGCPHCAVLEKWMADNEIESKIELTKLEIYNNEENKNLLIERAKDCGITNDIAIPFLWTGTDCIVGDEPIEQFFQQKLNLNTNITTNESTNSAQ